MKLRILLAAVLLANSHLHSADDQLVFEGGAGAGTSKHIVLVSGDEEYRSEECLPMLATMLSERHGFKCTVLFAIDPATGQIAPNVTTNIPGLSALQSADLMVLFTRFRQLPDDQMQHIADFLDSGRPVIGLRTATHSFAFPPGTTGRFAHYDWRSTNWPGGFGRQVLGETWVAHHGQHGTQSTRGVINPELGDHPILRGVTDVWGPTDVYAIAHLPVDARVLMHGQVLMGMRPNDTPAEGRQNDPMMPLVWVRDYIGPRGVTNFVLCSTIGSGPDFESEGLRRLIVNACHHLLGLEVPEKADVQYVSAYEPTFFGFGKFKPGLTPEDLRDGR
jgi:type 1 glutamine amidotransferase